MRLKPAGGKGGNRTVPLECAENFCCIYTWSLRAGQGHGELSHKGRTREYEQSCGLGVGLGAASWRRRGGCNHAQEWAGQREREVPKNPGWQGCHGEVTVIKCLLCVCVCVCVCACVCVRERERGKEREGERERIRY